MEYSELPGSGGVRGSRDIPPAPEGFGQDLPTHSELGSQAQAEQRGQLCLFPGDEM